MAKSEATLEICLWLCHWFGTRNNQSQISDKSEANLLPSLLLFFASDFATYLELTTFRAKSAARSEANFQSWDWQFFASEIYPSLASDFASHSPMGIEYIFCPSFFVKGRNRLFLRKTVECGIQFYGNKFQTSQTNKACGTIKPILTYYFLNVQSTHHYHSVTYMSQL